MRLPLQWSAPRDTAAHDVSVSSATFRGKVTSTKGGRQKCPEAPPNGLAFHTRESWLRVPPRPSVAGSRRSEPAEHANDRICKQSVRLVRGHCGPAGVISPSTRASVGAHSDAASPDKRPTPGARREPGDSGSVTPPVSPRAGRARSGGDPRIRWGAHGVRGNRVPVIGTSRAAARNHR